MALTNISSVITLGSDWSSVSLGDYNSFYLIGIKESKGADDTIDPKDVKRLSFEVGIESGITNKYLTIGYLTLNFDEITSSDAELNKVTAMARYIGYPSTFYIRPTEIYTDKERFTEGTCTLSVNINTVKLK